MRKRYLQQSNSVQTHWFTGCIRDTKQLNKWVDAQTNHNLLRNIYFVSFGGLVNKPNLCWLSCLSNMYTNLPLRGLKAKGAFTISPKTLVLWKISTIYLSGYVDYDYWLHNRVSFAWRLNDRTINKKIKKYIYVVNEKALSSFLHLLCISVYKCTPHGRLI